MTDNEVAALTLSNDPARLLAILRDTITILKREYRELFPFHARRFSFEQKRLYGLDGAFLQWKVRWHPDRPESYENQQTSVGTVELMIRRETEITK